MRTIVFWSLCFLYATYFLGSIPLPPVSGRPFVEDGTGASRFALYDGVSRQLSEWGNQSSFFIVIGILLVLFAIWMMFRSATVGVQRPRIPIVSFLLFLSTAFVAADYSREIKVEDFSAYAKARAEWVKRGSKSSSYPKWPTLQLKNAIRSQVPADIDSALDSVVSPVFGRIPAFSTVFEPCRALYRQSILESGTSPTSGPGGNYSFACRLMEGIIERFGSFDITSPTQCLYGPAVKILHALDRQGYRCALTAIRGENNQEKICQGFSDHFGTTDFSFCP